MLVHVPQWFESEVRSAHVPEQSVYPVRHWYPHLPAAHVGYAPEGAVHTLPHPPQFEISPSVGMQVPLHAEYPVAHWMSQ
jgi:hypothetical protein